MAWYNRSRDNTGYAFTNEVAAVVEDISVILSKSYAGTTLYGVGNSYMDNSYFFGQLAGQFGFSSVVNKATGGYRMQDTALTLNSPGDKVWTPGSQGLVIVNDLGNNLADADDTPNRKTALESARFVAALLSSGSKTENIDAGWTYDGSWIDTNMGYAGASGGGYAVTNTADAYVDIPVPAGTAYLVFYGGNGTDFIGGRFVVTQGSRTWTRDLNEVARKTAHVATLGTAPAVLRLDNLDAGVVRATFDLGGRTGNVIGAVDSLLVPAIAPPRILWLKPVDVVDPLYVGKPGLYSYLRGVPDTVSAEFPNVVVLDPVAAGWDSSTMLGGDQLHPNAAGSKHLLRVVSGGVLRA